MHVPLSQRPLIGVTAGHSDPAWVEERMLRYLDAVQTAGGEACLLAADALDGPPYRLPRHISGLLLCGGGDVHPRCYGQTPAGTELDTVDDARDEMELALVREALSANLPVLGICRGVQVLHVAMGGTLLQHIDAHRALPSGESVRHEVHVAPESLLARVLGCHGSLPANSRHHQALDPQTLGQTLRVSAWSLPDAAVVEAVESPAYRWVLGVQWHPERAAEVPEVHQRLFGALVMAARQGP